jgi:hypothetical protein
MRSRDAALAAKYTEDSGDDGEGAEEADAEEDGEGATHKEDTREESETEADAHTHTHTHTHTQEDEETIQQKHTLERLFALDAQVPNDGQRSHNSSFTPNGAHLESGVTNDGDDAAVFKPNVTGITQDKPPQVDNDSRQIARGLAQVLSSLA